MVVRLRATFAEIWDEIMTKLVNTVDLIDAGLIRANLKLHSSVCCRFSLEVHNLTLTLTHEQTSGRNTIDVHTRPEAHTCDDVDGIQ